MRHPIRYSICLILLTTAFALNAAPENWAQFRGLNHNNVPDATALPHEWNSDKNVRWVAPVEGRGWASPVVWDDNIFIATAIKEVAGKDTQPHPRYRSERVGKTSIYRWELHCLDLKSGNLLWKKVAFKGNPGIRTHPQNTYASETPVTDGKHVYVYFGMVGLFCYDFDGNLVWQKEMGGYEMDGDWGSGSSPILEDGILYLQIDSEDDSFLLALEPSSGDELWRIERDERSSWSSPMIWKNRIRTELVTNANAVRSYDPKTGKLLWSLKYPGGRASASPVGNADALYIGNEQRRDGGGVVFAVKAGAAGDITPAPGETTSKGVLWSKPDGGPEFASPLLYNDKLYIFGRNRGSLGTFDPDSGTPIEGISRLPRARSFWSSPWAHDGKIFCIDEAGTTFVIQAGSKTELLSTNVLGEQVRATPAFVDGAIIIRTEDNVYCIGE